uniref:Uncharacterized protein n=1 Tax=Alexandrium monilatum TaxID=311494 RepID=A0A7S4R9U6_9DINO
MERHAQTRSSPNLLDSALLAQGPEPMKPRAPEGSGRARSLAGRRVQAKVQEGARAPPRPTLSSPTGVTEMAPPPKPSGSSGRPALLRRRSSNEVKQCPKDKPAPTKGADADMTEEAPLDLSILTCVDSFVADLIGDAVIEDDDTVLHEYFVDSDDEVGEEDEYKEEKELFLEAICEVSETASTADDAANPQEPPPEICGLDLSAMKPTLKEQFSADIRDLSTAPPTPKQHEMFDYEDVYSLDGDIDIEGDSEDEALEYVQMAYASARRATSAGLDYQVQLADEEEKAAAAIAEAQPAEEEEKAAVPSVKALLDEQKTVEVPVASEQAEVLGAPMVQAKEAAQPKPDMPEVPLRFRPSVGSWFLRKSTRLPAASARAAPAPAVPAPAAPVQEVPEVKEAPAEELQAPAEVKAPEVKEAPAEELQAPAEVKAPEVKEAPAEEQQALAKVKVPEVKVAPAEKPQALPEVQAPEVKVAPAEKPRAQSAVQAPEVKVAPAEKPQALAEAPEVKVAPAEKPRALSAVPAPEVKVALAEKPQALAEVQEPVSKAAVAPKPVVVELPPAAPLPEVDEFLAAAKAPAPKAAAVAPKPKPTVVELPAPAPMPEVDEFLAEEQKQWEREEEDASKLVAEFLLEQAAEPRRPVPAVTPKARTQKLVEKARPAEKKNEALRMALTAPSVNFQREAQQHLKAADASPTESKKGSEPAKHSRRRTIIGAVVRDSGDGERPDTGSLAASSSPKSPSWALPTSRVGTAQPTAVKRAVFFQGSATGTVRQARQLMGSTHQDLASAFRMDSDTEENAANSSKRQPSIAAAYEALGVEFHSLEQDGESPATSRLQRVPSSSDPKFGLSAKQASRSGHRVDLRASPLSHAANSMVLGGAAAATAPPPSRGGGARRPAPPSSQAGFEPSPPASRHGRRGRVQLRAPQSAMAMDLNDTTSPRAAPAAPGREELARVSSSLGPLYKTKQLGSNLPSLPKQSLADWSIGSTGKRRMGAAGPTAAF